MSNEDPACNRLHGITTAGCRRSGFGLAILEATCQHTRFIKELRGCRDPCPALVGYSLVENVGRKPNSLSHGFRSLLSQRSGAYGRRSIQRGCH
jgi:hypothetical protein